MNKTERHIVYTLGFLPLIMVFGNSMLIPILPLIQSALHLSSFNTSMILSLFSVPAAITIPLVGFLSDRFGRKIIILYSLFIITIGSIFCLIGGFLTNPENGFYLLAFGRVIQGIGAGGTTPLAMALVGDLFDKKERGKILGILEVFNGVGKVIAPILGAILALIVWYVAFFIFPFMSLIILYGMFRYIKDAPSGNDFFSFRSYRKQLVETLKKEISWLLPVYVIGGVGLFLLFGILYYLSFFVEEIFHVDGFFKGMVFSIPLGALTICSYWTGKQIKTNESELKKLMRIGILIMLIMFSSLMFYHPFPYILFSITIAFSGLGFLLPCVNMLVTSKVDDSKRGFVVSLYGTARFLGVAIGPIIFNSWMENINTMFIYSFVLLLICSGWLYISEYRSEGETLNDHKI